MSKQRHQGVITPLQIEFSIKGMKHSIIEHLLDYEGQINEAIRQAATEYLDNVDFTALVREETYAVLRNSIRFRITDAVREAFEKACLAQDPISRRAERKRIAGWLDEPCKWHEHGLGDHPIDRILRTPKIVKRRCCEECWEELVDELEEVSDDKG